MLDLPHLFQRVPREEPFQLELLLVLVEVDGEPMPLVLEVETLEVLERLLVLAVGTYQDQELAVPVEVVGTYQAHLGVQEEAVLDQRD